MPELDEVSQAIGELKTICSDTKDQVNIIRGDTVAMRREIDWLKKSVDNITPYVPVMKDVDTVKRVGGKVGGVGVKVAVGLGGMGLLIPLWTWLESVGVKIDKIWH